MTILNGIWIILLIVEAVIAQIFGVIMLRVAYLILTGKATIVAGGDFERDCSDCAGCCFGDCQDEGAEEKDE